MVIFNLMYEYTYLAGNIAPPFVFTRCCKLGYFISNIVDIRLTSE